MNSMFKSKVALAAIGVASLVLAGSIVPAAAHKNGGGGGKHDKQEKNEKHSKHDKQPKQPKTPQNPGPIGPLPKPPVVEQPQWHATSTPVVRDHRLPSSGAKVTDHRKPTVDTSGGVTGRNAGRTASKTEEKKPAKQPASTNGTGGKGGTICVSGACPH